jgi:hypothetical protein
MASTRLAVSIRLSAFRHKSISGTPKGSIISTKSGSAHQYTVTCELPGGRKHGFRDNPVISDKPGSVVDYFPAESTWLAVIEGFVRQA